MLPVSRLGQPVGMVTATSPWLSVNCEPSPHWLWLTGWFQATPPLVFYPPAVWIPEYTHLWDRPSVKIIRLLPPPLSQSANLRHPHLSHPLPKILKRWMSPEEVSLFPRREKDHLTNQIIQIPGGRVPRTCHLCPSRLSGHVAAKPTTTETKTSPSLPLLHLPCPSASSPAEPSNICSSGGASNKQAVLDVPVNKGVWPIFHINQHFREAWLQPMTSLDGKLSHLLKVLKDIRPSSGFSSRVTLLTDNTHKKQRMSKGKASYGGTLLLSTDKQTVCVSSDREDKEEEKKDKRPVASTPVPGSSWYVVWTGDDRVFFFNPTIHLSVWERPGDLIDRDISCIIKDPPHKRKKTISSHEDDKHVHKSKRSRAEEPASLLPQPQEVQLLPLELRVAHFREMMLERGVSAFSTWEKELHKMVFDPRYLLLTPDQRKQVFDQFVKSRIKDEYKEKKNKLQKAREDFRQLLEEVKITSRCTFKQFCARYRSDHRFNALNRKQEQEVLFNHYITTLRKRNKENRARLRKMR